MLFWCISRILILCWLFCILKELCQERKTGETNLTLYKKLKDWVILLFVIVIHDIPLSLFGLFGNHSLLELLDLVFIWFLLYQPHSINWIILECFPQFELVTMDLYNNAMTLINNIVQEVLWPRIPKHLTKLKTTTTKGDRLASDDMQTDN